MIEPKVKIDETYRKKPITARSRRGNGDGVDGITKSQSEANISFNRLMLTNVYR